MITPDSVNRRRTNALVGARQWSSYRDTQLAMKHDSIIRKKSAGQRLDILSRAAARIRAGSPNLMADYKAGMLRPAARPNSVPIGPAQAADYQASFQAAQRARTARIESSAERCHLASTRAFQ